MGKVVGNQEDQNWRQILDTTVIGLCMNREEYFYYRVYRGESSLRWIVEAACLILDDVSDRAIRKQRAG